MHTVQLSVLHSLHQETSFKYRDAAVGEATCLAPTGLSRRVTPSETPLANDSIGEEKRLRGVWPDTLGSDGDLDSYSEGDRMGWWLGIPNVQCPIALSLKEGCWIR